MSRKRLWSLTALACGVLAIPSLPASRLPGLALDLAAVHVPRIDLVALAGQIAGRPSLVPGLAAAVALLLLLSVSTLIVRRRRSPVDLAVRLAGRGSALPAIARQTRLSQDAIRDLLGGDPVEVSTERGGRIFRRRSTPAPSALPSFADALDERAFEAKS